MPYSRTSAPALLAFAGLLANASAADAKTAPALPGECPNHYQVKRGLNVDFPIDATKRAFVVVPPATLGEPAPVWVPLTGTVESTNDNLHVARSGANALMTDKGFMVIGPARECANQDPDLHAGVGNGPGVEGWNWRPRTEGRARGGDDGRWRNDEGPDSRFLIAIVKCVAAKYPLDARRLYLGGISSGATLPNRALSFRSDFWAGRLPISGEWYVTSDDGKGLSFDAARAAVQASPAKIFQGRVGPLPLKTEVEHLSAGAVWVGRW